MDDDKEYYRVHFFAPLWVGPADILFITIHRYVTILYSFDLLSIRSHEVVIALFVTRYYFSLT